MLKGAEETRFRFPRENNLNLKCANTLKNVTFFKKSTLGVIPHGYQHSPQFTVSLGATGCFLISKTIINDRNN